MALIFIVIITDVRYVKQQPDTRYLTYGVIGTVIALVVLFGLGLFLCWKTTCLVSFVLQLVDKLYR